MKCGQCGVDKLSREFPASEFIAGLELRKNEFSALCLRVMLQNFAICVSIGLSTMQCIQAESMLTADEKNVLADQLTCMLRGSAAEELVDQGSDGSEITVRCAPCGAAIVPMIG
jgi:hypothetical protein